MLRETHSEIFESLAPSILAPIWTAPIDEYGTAWAKIRTEGRTSKKRKTFGSARVAEKRIVTDSTHSAVE
jgi:hypothetical protein